MAKSSCRGKLYHFFFSQLLVSITAPRHRSGGKWLIFMFVVADSVEEVACDYYNYEQSHQRHYGTGAVEYHAVGELT